MTELKYMSGNEFVRKILSGERDYSGIRLEAGFSLNGHESFNTLQDYLKKQDLRKSPIILSGSKLVDIGASEIHLPFTIAKETRFSDSTFENADFYGANFSGASFYDASLFSANLENAILRDAGIAGASFNEANLKRADLSSIFDECGDAVTWFLYADLSYATFKDSYFLCAMTDFSGANLEGANFENAELFKFLDFEGANLRNANMRGMKFRNTSFNYADLRGACLDSAQNLGGASFYGTIVSPKEKEIIQNAIALQLASFQVEEI